MRRLLVALRMLHTIMASTPLPDFALRLCVDEFCHGMFESRPLPWLTMVSCAGTPSLPVVHWNTLAGRDPALSAWNRVLEERLSHVNAQVGSWAAREAQAVWRGSSAEVTESPLHYVTLRYITLHYVTLRSVRLRYIAEVTESLATLGRSDVPDSIRLHRILSYSIVLHRTTSDSIVIQTGRAS